VCAIVCLIFKTTLDFYAAKSRSLATREKKSSNIAVDAIKNWLNLIQSQRDTATSGNGGVPPALRHFGGGEPSLSSAEFTAYASAVPESIYNIGSAD
jgi:hypothetical protein